MKHRLGWFGIVVFATLSASCSDVDEEGAFEGGPCDQDSTFRCSSTDAGDKTGALLICRGGRYELQLACRDTEGCFTEASNTIGRCFHGDGSGERCEASGPGEAQCCSFQEPNLDCS